MGGICFFYLGFKSCAGPYVWNQARSRYLDVLQEIYLTIFHLKEPTEISTGKQENLFDKVGNKEERCG